jgi:PAS domain S-box-containing protein
MTLDSRAAEIAGVDAAARMSKAALRAAERRSESLEKQLLFEIAERRRSEGQIIRERDNAQRYLDVAGVMILVLNEDATIRLINRHGCEILGYAVQEEIVGKPWIDTFIPERLRESIRDTHRRIANGEISDVEFHTSPVVTRTGEERIIAWHNATLTDPKNRLSGTLSSGEDITDRLRVEEYLRESEERFRSIFGAVSEGIMLINAATGTFADVNEAGAAIYGYEPHELIGRGMDFISSNVPPYTHNGALEWIEKAAATGQSQQFDWHARGKDGRLFWAEVSIRFARIGGGRFILSIVRDVTDRRATEARLRHAQKMEAIGTLAGGVAHELNNLLQPIIMMTELVMTELSEDSHHRALLTSVIDAGGKAAEIVQRILAFGRVDEVSHTALDISLVAREAIAFIRTILPSSITLHVDIAPFAGMLRGDKTQLTQILINFASNARDAIGANVGTVWVSLSRSHVKEESHNSKVGTLKRGDYAVLTVRDTGSGMDEETAARIFEPFFTTKGVGKGTGLGLSITHGIVTGHGGAIHVESTLGHGTSFSIYLPLSEADMALALAG